MLRAEELLIEIRTDNHFDTPQLIDLILNHLARLKVAPFFAPRHQLKLGQDHNSLFRYLMEAVNQSYTDSFCHCTRRYGPQRYATPTP